MLLIKTALPYTFTHIKNTLHTLLCHVTALTTEKSEWSALALLKIEALYDVLLIITLTNCVLTL